MFKSIFAKYISAITVIVLVSFCIMVSVIASILSKELAKQAFDEVEKTVVLGAEIIMYDYRIDEHKDLEDCIASHPEIRHSFERLVAATPSAYLWITDKDGKILLSGGEHGDVMDALKRDETLWDRINEALRTEGIFDEEAEINSLNASSYFISARYITDVDGNVGGISIACTSTRNTTGLIDATVQTVIMACLWIMLAMLIAVYFITERTVEPVRRMSLASKNYAKGKFDTRIEVIGNDEVAELSQAFNNMANELDMLEQKRNQFISDVSHELRSPMMSILGFVEGIRSGSVPKEKEGYYLDLTASEIKRLSRLVADLLDVSRLEMGEKKLNFTKCNICETARLVLISLEKRIDEKNLMIEFEAEEDTMFIRADADALHRVIYNLIENAIKFSREGALVRTAFSRNKNKEIVLEIYNEGDGIEKEDLPNIFDRFYKSDKSRGKDKKGVGLGLYFVKTLVMAHGGDVRAESEEGSYCRFILHFPPYCDNEK